MENGKDGREGKEDELEKKDRIKVREKLIKIDKIKIEEKIGEGGKNERLIKRIKGLGMEGEKRKVDSLMKRKVGKKKKRM